MIPAGSCFSLRLFGVGIILVVLSLSSPEMIFLSLQECEVTCAVY